MIESIVRGEVLIDRAVFMADTASRFMAQQPKLSAEDAFKRASSLWTIMVNEFAEKPVSETPVGDGTKNVIALRHG